MTKIKHTLPAVALLLSDSRGVYIPQNFLQNFDLTKWQGISKEAIECILSEDENGKTISPYEIELYWDYWTDILDNATFTENGYTWRLMQDGDLFAYCYELMTDEEKDNFGMED